MTFAKELFDSYHAHQKLVNDLSEKLFEMLPKDSFEDIRFDWYDDSLEIDGVKLEIVVEQPWVDAIFALGFQRIWFNCADGSEEYFYRKTETETGGSWKPHRQGGVCPRPMACKEGKWHREPVGESYDQEWWQAAKERAEKRKNNC